ncbi:hypothetical protein, partial [Anaplasma bovis]|uniref:hypothetical protein n=1 Tax=Anaplasma bovis TaxID=186733 RepID=UPI002FF1A2F5
VGAARPVIVKSGESSVSKKDVVASARHDKSGVGSSSLLACGVANSKNGQSFVSKKDVASTPSTTGVSGGSPSVSNEKQVSCKNGQSSANKKDVVASMRHDKSGVGNGSLRVAGAEPRPMNCESSKIPVKKYVAGVCRNESVGSGSLIVSVGRPANSKGSRIPISKKYVADVHRSESVDNDSLRATGRSVSRKGSNIPVVKNLYSNLVSAQRDGCPECGRVSGFRIIRKREGVSSLLLVQEVPLSYVGTASRSHRS